MRGCAAYRLISCQATRRDPCKRCPDISPSAPAGTDSTPAIVWILTGCVAIVGANALGLGPVAPAIAAGFGDSVTNVLRASAGYGLGTAIGALSLARFIDSLGARTMMRCALSALVVAFLCSALASGSMLLVGAQTIAGLAAGVLLPASYSVAASVAPPGQQNRMLGIVLTGWTISMVAGVSMSALLAEWLHWRLWYVAMAALACWVLQSLWHRAPAAERRGRLAPSPLRALRVPGVPVLLARVALYMMAFYGLYAYLGDYVVSQFALGVSANAWIAASYGVGFGLAATLDSWLDRLGSRRAISVSLLVLALVYLALAIAAQQYRWLLLAALLWGIVNHLAVNALIAALGAADPAQRGTVLGLYSATTYLCMSVATLGYGWVYEWLDFTALCYASAALSAMAAISRARTLQQFSRGA